MTFQPDSVRMSPTAFATAPAVHASSAVPADATGAADAAAPYGGLHRALRASAHEYFLARVDALFDGAGETLMEWCARPRPESARRHCLDVARLLRAERSRICLVFDSEVRKQLTVESVAEPPRMVARGDDESLEDVMALATIATRADTQCLAVLREFHRRVAAAIAAGVPLRSDLLCPGSLCEAFERAVESCRAEGQTRLEIYRLFDTFVMRPVADLYRGLTDTLAAHGHGGALAVAPAAAANAAPRDLQVAEALRHLDSALRGTTTVGSLAQVTLRLRAANDERPQWAQAVAQRLSMAGVLVDEIVNDPQLPQGLQAQAEALRASVLQAALSDPALVENAQHPLRQFLDEVHFLAVTAPLQGQMALQQVIGMLQKIQGDLQRTEQGLQAQLPQLPLVAQGSVEQFLQNRASACDARRARVVERVRSIVNAELSSRLRQTDIADLATPLYAQGLGPVLGLLLARHGCDSTVWAAMLQRVDALTASLRFDGCGADAATRRTGLLAALERDLRGAGLPEQRAVKLLDGLRAAYAELDARQVKVGAAALRAA